MSSRTPLLAGDFVTLAKGNGPCMTVASVLFGVAWVTYRVDGEVKGALLPVEALRSYVA